jgi:hypothetical protein
MQSMRVRRGTPARLSVRTRRFGRTALPRAWTDHGTSEAMYSAVTQAFDQIDVNTVIVDKLFGVDDGLLVLVDEWRVSMPPIMQTSSSAGLSPLAGHQVRDGSHIARPDTPQ